MNRIVGHLRPTPLTLLLLTAILGVQVALESSVSTTFLKADSGVMSITHVWGGVLTTDMVRGETVYVVAWWELLARLLGSYALAAFITVSVHDASVRRLVTLLGLGTLFVLAGTFFFTITVSKYYWGYYFHRPQVLPEIYDVSSITSITVLTHDGIPYSGWRDYDALTKYVA